MDIIKCRLGCEKIFKSNDTRYRHEKTYCDIIKNKLKDTDNIFDENIKLKITNKKLKDENISLKSSNKNLKDKNLIIEDNLLKLTEKYEFLNKEYIKSLKLTNEITVNVNEKLIKMNKETIISSIDMITLLTE